MYKKTKYLNGMLFYPTFVVSDLIVIFAFLAIFCLAIFFFPDLLFTGDSEIPADPFNTPEHIKPEWYFLAPYQFLKLIPELTALVVQTLGMLALVFLPFIDRSEKKGLLRRPAFTLIAMSVLIFWIWLTLWGATS